MMKSVRIKSQATRSERQMRLRFVQWEGRQVTLISCPGAWAVRSMYHIIIRMGALRWHTRGFPSRDDGTERGERERVTR